jgi:hypothetical protein
MRPTYERSQDRKKQEELILLLWAEHPSLECFEMPRFAPYDYEFRQSGKAVAMVEVKARSLARHRLPNYVISCRKMDTLRELVYRLGCPAYLLVGFADGVSVFQITQQLFPRRTSGRRDRNDPQDMELCEFIPIKLFRALKGNEINSSNIPFNP